MYWCWTYWLKYPEQQPLMQIRKLAKCNVLFTPECLLFWISIIWLGLGSSLTAVHKCFIGSVFSFIKTQPSVLLALHQSDSTTFNICTLSHHPIWFIGTLSNDSKKEVKSKRLSVCFEDFNLNQIWRLFVWFQNFSLNQVRIAHVNINTFQFTALISLPVNSQHAHILSFM